MALPSGYSVNVGVDVGGTKVNIVILDSETDLLLDQNKFIISETSDNLVGSIAKIVTSLTTGHKINFMGIGLPGMVNKDNTMTFSPHIEILNGHNLASELSESFRCLIRVENDANCALIGERLAGIAKDSDNVLMVTLGTGIGGAMITDGHFLLGHEGYIGEIGHMTVIKDGSKCICGKSGCWEIYAASSSLTIYYELFKNFPELMETTLTDREYKLFDTLNTDDLKIRNSEAVMENFKSGETIATAALHTMMNWVAVGLSSLSAIMAPEIVVIGGGIVTEYELYKDILNDYFKQYSSHSSYLPLVVPAKLGANAGAIGAALLCKSTDR
jgi:glucokinase